MPHRLLVALLSALAAALPAAAAQARTVDLSTGAALTSALASAAPGDVLRLAPGTYRGTFRPTVSGTAASPIRLVAAAPGVVLDGGTAANTLKLISVGHWSLQGLTITGGASQAVWIESTQDVTLDGVTVTASPGVGVELKHTAGTTIQHATLTANGSAGVLELAGTTGTRILANDIERNGIGHATYNGDGIQLGGTGALVSGNTLVRNGDPGPYEHGVYTAAAATGWTLSDNTISDSGGADIKAQGSGTVAGNRLTNGMYGLVLASNPAPVQVTGNTLSGRAQHLVFLTDGARAALSSDTIRQSGRSTSSGEASAIFVKAAGSLSVSHTTACYDNADDLGVGLWINAAAAVGSLSLSGNTYCSHDARGRSTAYNGSRVAPATWVAATADATSLFTAA